MADLMPCPFCGSRHGVVLFSGRSGVEGVPDGPDVVACTNCNASGPPVMGMRKARDAWNRRAMIDAGQGRPDPRPMSDAPRNGTPILARWPATQHGQERTGWVTTWCDGDRWWTPWTMAFVDAPGGPDAWRDHP